MVILTTKTSRVLHHIGNTVSVLVNDDRILVYKLEKGQKVLDVDNDEVIDVIC